ncbi:MAG: hypothetical protein VB102_14705 [Paludibacter sp.]|nr:hypothetical protein [Paludibacter sp.]
MKTLIYSFLFIAISATVLSGCEESEATEELLNDVTEGKMVVEIDGDRDEIFNCTFNHFGEGEGLSGEIFINGTIPGSTDKYLTLMYGSFQNTTALTKKSYSTDNSEDMMTVSTSYGYIENGTRLTITIVEVTDTAIKGTFTGNLSKQEGNVNIDGAFWALKEEQAQ